jgi:hypothetical protein
MDRLREIEVFVAVGLNGIDVPDVPVLGLVPRRDAVVLLLVEVLEPQAAEQHGEARAIDSECPAAPDPAVAASQKMAGEAPTRHEGRGDPFEEAGEYCRAVGEEETEAGVDSPREGRPHPAGGKVGSGPLRVTSRGRKAAGVAASSASRAAGSASTASTCQPAANSGRVSRPAPQPRSMARRPGGVSRLSAARIARSSVARGGRPRVAA